MPWHNDEHTIALIYIQNINELTYFILWSDPLWESL